MGAKQLLTVAILLAACGSAIAADPGKLTIQVDKPGAAISPTLYGLMTEEINYSYDGGLYGELVQNRIFQNVPPAPRGGRGGRGRGAAAAPASAPAPTPASAPARPIGSLAHWSVYTSGGGAGTLALDQEQPVNSGALKTEVRLDITAAGGQTGLANDGFWGIPVHPDSQYRANFYARSGNGFSGPLTVAIVGNDGTIYASAKVDSVGQQWQHHTVTLKTGKVAPTADAKFVLSGGSKGSLWFNLVSLFPPTFHGRVNGFRPDLMQLLDNMHPAFLRFPGGNYVEGQDFANRFNWKETIGDYSQRPGHESPWRYRSSDGMGLLEFLEWCEDLKMEPVLAVYAGYNLDRTSVPAEDYPRYAQEAVEEIEYVMGDKSTRWGAQRAKDGHPEPFKLHYVEIGNEDNLGAGMGTYDARFAVFAQAIRAKYPQLELISSAGDRPLKTVQPDLQDEHHYPSSVGASLALANSFDKRPRTGPKVFVGEWATRIGNPTPQFSAAMADAAFMCGIERNADLVKMFCYAPLLVNVSDLADRQNGSMQWPSDMIGYNALTSFGSPAYYVEKMFYTHKGDRVLPIVELTPQTPGGALPGTNQDLPPLYSAASRDDKTGDVILKVVNTREGAQQMTLSFAGASTIRKDAIGEILSGPADAVNTIADPLHCVPQKLEIHDAAPSFVHEFPGMSVSVIRFKTR